MSLAPPVRGTRYHTLNWKWVCGIPHTFWVCGKRNALRTRDVLRVPGLRIRDCTRDCNNCVHMRAQISAIDVTKKILFQRLYLVSGMSTFGPWVDCPYAPTTPTIHNTTISRNLCNFFPRMAPHFFGHHDLPSNLAKSLYPRRVPFATRNAHAISAIWPESIDPLTKIDLIDFAIFCI